MGDIKRAECKKCGYQRDFNTGCGMLYFSFGRVLQMFDTASQKEIQEIYTNDTIWSCEKVIAKCDSCRDVIDTPVFICGDKRIAGRCECGGKCKEKKGAKKIQCPSCGEEIEIVFMGHWD